jgi:hypothetical protein
VHSMDVHPTPESPAIVGSARQFCVIQCRGRDGTCPLARASLPPSACPLWRFVQASDGPSTEYVVTEYSVDLHLALKQADPDWR